MSTQKPIFLLAGGRGTSGKSMESFIQAIFKEAGHAVPTIAYVGVANEDNWVFYKLIAGMIKKAGNCQINRVLIAAKNADLKKARSILESADIIFMSGGDVEAGMRILIEKNMADFFQELYQKGKIFFGASAGSIMLAKKWVRWRDPEDDSTAEFFPCLGLAPVICDTHAESDDWEELQALLRLENTSGYGIATESCLKVSFDGKVEALGGAVFQYICHEGKVERLADIVPS